MWAVESCFADMEGFPLNLFVQSPIDSDDDSSEDGTNSDKENDTTMVPRRGSRNSNHEADLGKAQIGASRYVDREDEFYYDEDEFHEDHPFIETRMTASCEGVFSIIGDNNGYHGQETNQLEMSKHRAYATSMPHIPSECESSNPNEIFDQLIKSKKVMSNDVTEETTSTTHNRKTKSNASDASLQGRVIGHVPDKTDQNAADEAFDDGEDCDTLDLEFEYEPGISLSHMEFGRQNNVAPLNEVDSHEKCLLDQQRPFHRKMSEMCTSSSCSTSQKYRYQSMMMGSSISQHKFGTSPSKSEKSTTSPAGCSFNAKSPLVSPTRCTYCGVDYESGK